MAAMTDAQIDAEIEAIEAEIQASRSSIDFSTSAPGGGSLSVSGTNDRRRQLMKDLRYWKMERWKRGGCKVAETARIGIDVERNTSNGDDWG